MCSAVSFTAGYAAFYPGWRRSPPLGNGMASSFTRPSEPIEPDDLLAKASPQQRVSRLLEVCRQADSLGRDHTLYEAIQRMQPADFLAVVTDLPALARELRAMKAYVRQALIEASLDRWLEIDEPNALRWLAASRAVIESGTIELPEMDFSDMWAAYTVLARKEADWTFKQVGTLGPKMQRSAAIGSLLIEGVQRDPRKAREWLDSFRGSKDWAVAFDAYVRGLGRSDPRAAVEMALAEEKTHLVGASSVHSILYENVAGSASLAAELLGKIEPPDRRRATTWFTMFGIAENSAADPLDWLKEQAAADPERLSFASGEIARGRVELLVSRDPLRTIDWAKSLPSGQREKMFEGVLSSWAELDAPALLDWLSTQPVEALPANLSGIDVAAAQEPERFARWVTSLPPGELRERSQLTIANELAKHCRVAEALRHFPQSSTTDSFTQLADEFAASIARQDPTTASKWAETLPAGATRDAASGALAGVLAPVDPQLATEWLAQISDPAARDRAAGKVFRSWMRVDSTGARRWLRDAETISYAAKSRLLRSR